MNKEINSICFVMEQICYYGGAERLAYSTIKQFHAYHPNAEISIIFNEGDAELADKEVEDYVNVIRCKDWSSLPGWTESSDYVIVVPDWNSHIVAQFNKIKEVNPNCKLIWESNTSFNGFFGWANLPQNSLINVFDENKDAIDLVITFNKEDEYAFNCIGVTAMTWNFGTVKAQEFDKTAVYNRVIAVASNWTGCLKHVADADEILEYAKWLGYETELIGLCMEATYGKYPDNVKSIEDIYKPGTIIVMPSTAEARSNQILEANQFDIPVLTRKQWCKDCENQLDIKDYKNILKNMLNQPIVKYANPRLNFTETYPEFEELLFLAGTVKVSEDPNYPAWSAYQNALGMTENLEQKGYQMNYVTAVSQMNNKLAYVIMDGRGGQFIQEAHGRQIVSECSMDHKTPWRISQDFEYYCFMQNSMVQANAYYFLINEHLGHHNIVIKWDKPINGLKHIRFIAIQSSVLKLCGIHDFTDYYNDTQKEMTSIAETMLEHIKGTKWWNFLNVKEL